MEIEAKYAITAALHPGAINRLALRPYTLSDQGIEDHSDVLLDTCDMRITSRQHALRIRTTDAGVTLTFKGPNTGSGGVHVRQEWEAPLTTSYTLDPSTWPDPISGAVQELADDEPLIPLLRVVVQRHTWAVKRVSRTIGELALDSGVILAAGRRETLHELELELKGIGARSDLDALNDRLMEALPLQPETRSKLHRGLALLRHATWTLDGYTSLSRLANHYIHRQTRAARAAVRDVLDGGSPDSIHDARVAIRRMRSALLELEGIALFDQGETRALRRRLRAAARRLGAVRDLDIAIERLSSAANERGHVTSQLMDTCRARRAVALAQVQGTLASGKFHRTLSRLDSSEITAREAGRDALCAPARDYAGGVLWGRFDALTRRDMAIQLGEAAGMHQARITAKRMRYTLELFAPAMGGSIAPVRRALIAFQESFGTLQDIAVTQAAIADGTRRSEDTPGMTALQLDLQEQRARALALARSAWDDLTAPAVRQALASAVAAL